MGKLCKTDHENSLGTYTLQWWANHIEKERVKRKKKTGEKLINTYDSKKTLIIWILIN